MLQDIRDRAQGWLAWVIIGVITLSFALFGIQHYLTASGGAVDTAAKINGVNISQADVTRLYQRIKAYTQNKLGPNLPINKAMSAALQHQALQQLISTSALSQSAEKLGYKISQPQLDALLKQVPAFQVKGQFSPQLFQQILVSQGITSQQFLAGIVQDLIIQQIQSGVQLSAFALPSEVNNITRLVNQTRSFSYLQIPFSRYKQNVKISNQKAKIYYKANLAKYQLPEKVSLEYLELSLPTLVAAVKPTPQEIKQYYLKNQTSYTKPASWHVAHILLSIPSNATPKELAVIKKQAEKLKHQAQSGVNFSNLAKKYSTDIVTAKKGGVLPWFIQGDEPEGFQAAIAGITRIGGITGPVKTKYGYEIIKLLGKKAQKTLPLRSLSTQISRLLANQKAQQQFAEASDKLANLTYENPDTLLPASKALGLKVQTTKLFTRAGGKSKLTQNAAILATSFNSNVLKEGNNSDVVQLTKNTVVVLRIKKHKLAAPKPFKEVEQHINELLTQQMSEENLKKAGEKLLANLQNGTSQQALAKQTNLKWQNEGNIHRHESKPNQLIINAAFSLPKPAKGKHSNMGLSLPNGDYLIIVLENIISSKVAPKDAKTQQLAFTQEAKFYSGQIDYNLYKASKLSQAKIKISPTT